MHYFHIEDSKASLKTVGIGLRGQERKKKHAGKRKKCVVNLLRLFSQLMAAHACLCTVNTEKKKPRFLGFYYSAERRGASTGEAG